MSVLATVPSYLLSIEMERLLVRVATVSLFSLLIVGSEEEEEEEEKTEAGELSFTESKRDTRTTSRERSQCTCPEWRVFPFQTLQMSV